MRDPVLNRPLFRRAFQQGGPALSPEDRRAAARDIESQSLRGLQSLFAQQPQPVPDVFEEASRLAPQYEQFIAGEDAQRQAQSRFLLDVAQAGLSLAGGRTPEGIPLSGSFVSRLAQSAAGLPGAAQREAAALQQMRQQTRTIALQAAQQRVGSVEEANRQLAVSRQNVMEQIARKAIERETAEATGTVAQNIKRLVLGDQSWDVNLNDPRDAAFADYLRAQGARMYNIGVEPSDPRVSLSPSQMQGELTSFTTRILSGEGVENLTTEELDRFSRIYNQLESGIETVTPQGVVRQVTRFTPRENQAYERAQTELRQRELAPAVAAPAVAAPAVAAPAPDVEREIEERDTPEVTEEDGVWRAGSAIPSSENLILQAIQRREERPTPDPTLAVGVRGALLDRFYRAVGALGFPTDPGYFEARAKVYELGSDILDNLRSGREGRMFAAEIERLISEIPTPSRVAEPSEDVSARLLGFTRKIERMYSRAHGIVNDDAGVYTASEKREARTAMEDLKEDIEYLYDVLSFFPEVRTPALRRIRAREERTATGEEDAITITSEAEYEALLPGAIFIGPDGVRRRKP